MNEYGVPAQASAFKPKKLLTALRRFWWVPFLTTILGIGAGAALVYYMPATYVSRASMVEAVKIRLPEGGLFAEDLQTYIGTQTELLKSPAIQELAVARIRASGTNVHIPLDKKGDPEQIDIQLRQSAKSAFFVLTATGSEPNYTRAFLDALMQAYLSYKRDIKKTVSGDTIASISEQVQRSERDLKEAQDAYSAYQRSNNLAIVQQEATVAGTFLAQLRTRLADLELESQLLEAAALGTNTAPEGDTVSTNAIAGWYQPGAFGSSSATSGTVPPEVQLVLRELAGLRIQKERLERFLRPKHPKMVKLTADIERIEGLLAIYRRQNEQQIAASRRTLQTKLASVQASIHEWQGKVIEANSKLVDADRLQRQIDNARDVYERVALLLQNVGISRNIDQDTLSVLQSATPAERSFRNEISAFSGATLGGLAFGLGILALIAFRDDRFDTHTDLDEALGGALVGQIPEIDAPPKGSLMPLLAQDDARHMFAESYRSLRSALLYLASDASKPRVVLITSAAPSEGKSTITVNLARTLAFGGAKVVVIDADLRRGHLHKVLGGEPGPGLAEAIAGEATLDAVVQQNGLTNLCFITGGREVPNPGDVLLSPSFPQILKALRERFDYVLIDSCPVFAADDASTIAPQVDGTLLVVRRGYSRSGLVREALDVLQQRQARILGVVFNRADTSLRSYRYYKYSEYYGRKKKPAAGK